MLIASSGGGALLVIAVLYFLPLLIALGRKVPNQGSVAVVNILLGWTLIGWVIALAMAARSVPAPVQQVQVGPAPEATDQAVRKSGRSGDWA
jgi:hypothetical protein